MYPTEGTYGKPRNLKLFVFIGIALIAGIALIVFFANNVIAFVNVKNTTTGSSVTLSRVVSDTESKKIGGSGMVIIPRGSEDFEVTGDNSAKTLTRISQPWFGFTSKTIDLRPTKNASKVAFAADSELCVTYNKSQSAILRYDCKNPSSLIESQTPTDSIWGERVVADLSYIEGQTLPAYLGGVIGITTANAPTPSTDGHSHDDQSVTITATSSENKNTYKAPGDISADNLSSLRLYTDSNSSSNPRFVLVDRFGTIYLATPTEDGKESVYKQVSAPDTYNSAYNQTSCTVHDAEATCYRSRNTTAVADGATALMQGTVEQLSFVDGSVSSVKVQDSPQFTNIIRAGSVLYGVKDSDVFSLIKSGDAYVSTKIAQDATAIAGKDSLYYVKNGTVFSYDNVSHDSVQVFSSSNIKVMGLYAVDGKTFLFGTTKDSETIIFAYELNDTNYDGKKRLIDVLPLAENTINEIYANDFVGDKLFLQLYGDSIADDDVRQLFIDKVKEKGIEVKAENIQTNR